MAKPSGYRIECATVDELRAFVGGVRADAMAILERRFTLAVADDAARRVDLHRVDADPRPADGNPMRDAVRAVRAAVAGSESPSPEVDMDLEMQFLMPPGAVLARISYGCDEYRLLLDRPGARPYDWSADRPRPADVDAREWAERGALWAKADAKPSLGSALTLHLLDGTIPLPRWQKVARAVPPFETRARRTAKALAWRDRAGTPAPATAAEAADFRRWLATPAGIRSYDRARRFASSALPGALGREALSAYGRPMSHERRAAAVEEGARPIDHADVYETVSGSIYVVVWDCGLGVDDRVVVQVSDGQVDFVQAGRHFGSVVDAPRAALEILASTGDITLVEMRKNGDRVEVKAKHVAIVRNTSMSDSFAGAMARWRDTASRRPRDRIEELL